MRWLQRLGAQPAARFFLLAAVIAVTLARLTPADDPPPATNVTPLQPTAAKTPPTVPTLPAPDTRQSAEIARLVQELGHETFERREAAASALKALGPLALEQVEQALKHPDPEISVRAGRLIPGLRAAAARTIADAFLTGGDSVTLPGWPEFSAVVGADAAARASYARLYSVESTLLVSVVSALQDGQTARARELTTRAFEALQEQCTLWQDIGRSNPALIPATLSERTQALVYLWTRAGCHPDLAQWQLFANQVLQFAVPYRVLLAEQSPAGEQARRLLSALCLTAEDNQVVFHALRVCALNGLDEAALKIARKTLARTVELPELLGYALLALSRGQRDDMPLAARYLLNHDEPWANSYRKDSVTEVADVALFALIRLGGQSPADFKLIPERAQIGLGPKVGPDGRLSSYAQLALPGFNSPADREAGFARFREWAATQTDLAPLFPTPAPIASPTEHFERAVAAELDDQLLGRRLRNWRKLGGGFINEVWGDFKLENGRLTHGSFRQMNGEMTAARPAGNSGLFAAHVNFAAPRLEIESLADDPATETYQRLSLRSDGMSLTLTARHYRPDELLAVHLTQTADRIDVRVQRTPHRDGGPTAEKTATAPSAGELRTAQPELWKLVADALAPLRYRD